MRVYGNLAAALLIATLSSACSDDPVVGSWQSRESMCADEQVDRFSIDSDLGGTGTMVVDCQGGTGDAVLCAASMTAIERESIEGRWTLEADFGYCEAMDRDLGRGTKDCAEQSEGDELRCCNPDGTGCLTYVRSDG